MFKGQTLTDSSLVDMSLSQRISEDLTRALKAKDEIRISSIRMLKSNLKNEQVKIGRELNDEEIQRAVEVVADEKDRPIFIFARRLIHEDESFYLVTGDKGLRTDLVKKELKERSVTTTEFFAHL